MGLTGASLNTVPPTEQKDSGSVSFFVRLSDNEFEQSVRSWRCPALDLPGSSVQDVYARGSRIDKEKYRVIDNQSYIRWIGDGEPPEHISAQIIVNSEKRSKLEDDKKEAEKKEAWWRNFGVTVPIVVALIAAIASWSSSQNGSHVDVKAIRDLLGKVDESVTNASNSIPDSCPGGKHGQTPDNGPRTISSLNDARTSVGQIRNLIGTAK